MVPVVNGIIEDYEQRVRIVIVDCYSEEGSAFAERLAIQYLPTFVFVGSDGEIQDTIVGATSARTLKKQLDALD